MVRLRFSLRTSFVLVTITGAVAFACFYYRQTKEVAALNSLRDEINATYGFKDGTPRINCGPCLGERATCPRSFCLSLKSAVPMARESWKSMRENV